MHKTLKITFLIIIVCCVFTKVNAQHTLNIDNKPKLNSYQDSLITLSEEIYTANDNISRVAKNTLFVKKFVEALKINGSFNYNFDSLKHVTILKSTDNSFRIITWFIPTTEGTYRYYGTIQMATTNGSLKLFPLTDNSNNLIDVNAISNNKNWYGARYYEMLPVIVNGKQPYFILLGWKGNNLKTSKKVIEVLSFDKGEPVFGKNLFETSKNEPLKNRVIFEYNRANSMTLTYNKSVNMIVFDHLVPYDPQMVGNFEFYATDSSFNGYKLVYGKLALAENVELKNDASVNDDFYGKPIKASNVNTKSGH